MNARNPIQPSTVPRVLSVAFSSSRKRFVASLSDGLRVLRTDNCLTTHQPKSTAGTFSLSGVSIAEALDDRYVAYVQRTSGTSESGNVVVFWDCFREEVVCEYDVHEPILGLRLTQKWLALILRERTILFAYQEMQPQRSTKPQSDPEAGYSDSVVGPNQLHALYPTSSNVFAVASLRNAILALPAQSVGQVQLIPLPGGSKRVIRAHNSSIRRMSLSSDGRLLATASETGTLIRVFDTATTDQVAEFRRGMEKAIVFSLAFSPENRWLASTSDKGTLHVFDLRPSSSSDVVPGQQTEKSSASRRPVNHRLSGGTTDRDSLSAFSGRSSPGSNLSAAAPSGTGYQGSVQEYYGLRPPPASATAAGRETAMTAMSAIKASSWAPKALKDTRSVASAPFWMGSEGLYWQQGGGATFRWTTTPNGTRKRVRNPVIPLANDPSGRPPKGMLTFEAPDGDAPGDVGAVIYVLGGGIEGRWEVFDLVSVPPPPGGGGTGWVLVKRGFRKFLSRQFAD